jgi:hypothetical protein
MEFYIDPIAEVDTVLRDSPPDFKQIILRFPGTS